MITDNDFNNFDFYLKGIVDEKKILKEIQNETIDFIELIKNINWDELTIEEDENNSNTTFYEIRFSEEIENKIENIKEKINRLNHLKQVGENILYGGDIHSFVIRIQVSKINKRIDISGDGIPISIRGLNLGWKLYRAIIEKEEYIITLNKDLSGFGKLLWNSLRNNENLVTFFHENGGFCFSMETQPNRIIKILENETKYFENLLFDNTFLEKNNALINSSELKRFI